MKSTSQWPRLTTHGPWFLASNALLIVGAFMAVKGVLAGSLVLVAVHILASVDAIFQTNFGRRHTATYSPDCIWFNWGMALLNGGVIFATLYFSGRP